MSVGLVTRVFSENDRFLIIDGVKERPDALTNHNRMSELVETWQSLNYWERFRSAIFQYESSLLQSESMKSAGRRMTTGLLITFATWVQGHR